MYVFHLTFFPIPCFFHSTISKFLIFNVFHLRRFVPFRVFSILRFVPFSVFSIQCFFHSTFLTIRPFDPVNVFSVQCFVPFGVFSFNVLSHLAFCLLTFCPSRFFYFWRFLLRHFVGERFCHYTFCFIRCVVTLYLMSLKTVCMRFVTLYVWRYTFFHYTFFPYIFRLIRFVHESLFKYPTSLTKVQSPPFLEALWSSLLQTQEAKERPVWQTTTPHTLDSPVWQSGQLWRPGFTVWRIHSSGFSSSVHFLQTVFTFSGTSSLLWQVLGK